MARPRKPAGPPPRVDYAAEIPALLRAWRAVEGLTQEQAAARLDVPLGTWIHWEAGRMEPQPDGPLRIALKAQAAHASP